MADPILCRPLPFTISAVGNETTVGPATNLNNDNLGRAWRTTGSTYVIVDLGAATDVDTIALLATNAASGDTVRVRASNTLANLTGAAPSGPFLVNSLVNAQASAEASKRVHRQSLCRPGTINARYWRIDVTTSLGSFAAGRLVLGKALQASDGADYSWTFEVFDHGATEVTRIGQEDSLIGAKVMLYRWTWSWMNETEARGPLLDILSYAGITRPVLFCFDPAAADLHNTIAFGPMMEGVRQENYAQGYYQAEFALRSKLVLSL